MISALIGVIVLAIALTANADPDSNKRAKVEVAEGMETAIVGAGCFWCVEAFYERLGGVHEAISGYAGGSENDPNYSQVAGGRTSHAEVVKVIYDPEVITYRELVDFFWNTHDVTRSDGVWPDFGPQYRSILLFQNDEERLAIEASKEAYEIETGKKVATEIKALKKFYAAENYHQDFAKRNPNHRYILGVLVPKLEKLGLK